MDSRTPPLPPSAPRESLPPALAPAVESDYNRLGTNFRLPLPRPKVKGAVIDFHCHLLANAHARDWFDAAAHYGIDRFLTMTPLEEVVGLQRDWPGRIQFIAVPRWGPGTELLSKQQFLDDWRRRLDGFFNLGSRMVKFHMAPGTLAGRNIRLDSAELEPVFRDLVARKVAVMTHVGDPDTWYHGKYATDVNKYGTREDHYRMWEDVMNAYPQLPWVGAHMGGNPEDLNRLQGLLDRHPQLLLDCSATRWMAREISARRDAARDFFIRNQDRILFGSDQVSGNDRGFDFLASRFWVHRKLWETGFVGPCPICDPDLPLDCQPTLRGLALPDAVLQKLYRDNAVKFLAKIGMSFPGDETATRDAA